MLSDPVNPRKLGVANRAFPFTSPEKHLETIAIGRLVENPKAKIHKSDPLMPSNIIGFLPNLSLARPQKIPVKT